MKTEMKSKNKMFLALAVVAALAMVSVAGIALQSDDSAADKRLDPIGINDRPVIAEESGAIEWRFYINESTFAVDLPFGIGFNIGFIEIPRDVTVTGTISIGTYDDKSKVYTALDTIQLNGVSGAKLTMIAVWSSELNVDLTFFMVGNYDSPFDFDAITEIVENFNGIGDLYDQILENNPYTGTDVPPTGDFELVLGDAMLGAVTPEIVKKIVAIFIDGPGDIAETVIGIVEEIRPFTGKIVAGDLTVESVCTLGTFLTVAEDEPTGIAVAAIGLMLNFEPESLDEILESSLSISGTGSIVYPAGLYAIANAVGLTEMYNVFAFALCNVTLEDGAVLNVGDKMPENVLSATIDLGDITDPNPTPAEKATDWAATYAFMFDENGSVVRGDVEKNGKVIFYAPIIGKEYNVVIVGSAVDGTTTELMYYGTMKVTGTPDSYKVTLGKNVISSGQYGKIDAADAFVFDASTNSTTLNYNAGSYEFIMGFNYSQVTDATVSGINTDMGISVLAKTVAPQTKTIGTNTVSVGGIDFTFNDDDGDSVKIANGDAVFMIMKNRSQNQVTGVYFGAVVADNNGVISNTAANEAEGVYTVDKTELVGTIKAGEVASGSSKAFLAPFIANFTVKGTINVLYTTEDVYGQILNLGYISVEDNGMIVYEVEPEDDPVVPLDGLLIKSAYYYENTTDDNDVVTKSTYYYTTLENAMKASNFVTLTGIHIITDEVTLETMGTEDATLVIGFNSALWIGWDNAPDTEFIIFEDGVGTLNIPKNIEIIPTDVVVNIGPIQMPSFAVFAGMASFEKETEDWLPLNPPQADILRNTPAYAIYADAVTALETAESGDELKLLQDATLRDSATVKEGVTFEQDTWDLTLNEGDTLTVEGTYTANGDSYIDGTISIEKEGVVNVVDGTMNLDNTIYVGPDATLNVGTSTKVGTIAGTENSAIDNDGTVNVNGTSTVLVNDFYNQGAVVIATNAGFTAFYIVIGEEPELSTEITNDATVTGKLTIAADGSILVFGTPAGFSVTKNVTNTVDKTDFMIGKELLYATQYAIDADPTGVELFYLQASKLKDLELVGWYTDPTFVEPLFPSSMPDVADFKAVYGYFKPRMYSVTLEYEPGVEWTIDGEGMGTSAKVKIAYGTEIKVNAKVLQGYEGTPVILKDGSSYTAGSAYKVTGDVSFSIKEGSVDVAEEKKDDGGLTLIEILLIIIIIIIAIIALVVAIKLLRS